MKKFTAFSAAILAGLSVLSLPVTAYADPRRNDQENIRSQMKAGEVKKLRDIEARIIPRMKDMRYVGNSYDPEAMVYILRFMKGERVVDVFVDARSGAILRRR